MGTEELFEQIDHLLDRISAVELPQGEETGALGRFIRQRSRTTEFLQEADRILRDVEERFEAEETARPSQEADPEDTLVDIGHMISTEMAAQGLADLAFIARGDLRACLQDLRAAGEEDPWRVASVMDRSLRRIRRGLISVESAICEFEGREGPIRFWGDLDTSLEIRRLYGELRREAKALDEDGGASEPAQRIEQIAGRFTDLASHRIYPLLRIDDRQQIRRLHRRMRRFLLDAEGPEGEGSEAGQRLWQDVVGFVSLLSAVNQREELRQHDRSVVDRAYKKLFGGRGVAFLSEGLLRELRALQGLDEELDELILRPDSHPLGSWQGPLGRLRTRFLSKPKESPSPFN